MSIGSNTYPVIVINPEAKHEWVGLTDEEVQECGYEAMRLAFLHRNSDEEFFAKQIEAKLKEKNR